MQSTNITLVTQMTLYVFQMPKRLYFWCTPFIVCHEFTRVMRSIEQVAER